MIKYSKNRTRNFYDYIFSSYINSNVYHYNNSNLLLSLNYFVCLVYGLLHNTPCPIEMK